MWLVSWLSNGPHLEPIPDGQDAALLEEHRLRFGGNPHVIAWFCAGWEARA